MQAAGKPYRSRRAMVGALVMIALAGSCVAYVLHQRALHPATDHATVDAVDLVRRSGADHDIIGRIGAGEYVGEVGLLTGAAHAVTATARTYCEICRIPREAVAPMLSSNAVLAADFDRSVRRGLGILQREVAVRASPSIGPTGQLLARIRGIFALGSTSARNN